MSLPWPNLTTEDWEKLLREQAGTPPPTALTAQPDSSIIDLGGPGSGNFGHAGRPGEVGGSGGDGGGDDRGAGSASRLPLRDHATPEDFIAARGASTRPGYLSPLTTDDLKDQKLYLTKDGTVGGAMTKDGDMGNLFNNGGPKGAAHEVLLDMIRDGGKTADAFDGYLPTLYANFGLQETGRMKFNPEYAPPGWNFERDDSPDVVFLSRTGAAVKEAGSADAIRGRVKDKGQWIAPKRATKYYDDYDEAKRDALTSADQGGARSLGALREGAWGRMGREAWGAGAGGSQGDRRPVNLYRDKLALLLGGPGSGNFGHAGRPGERGGSGEGDGGTATAAPTDATLSDDIDFAESPADIRAALDKAGAEPLKTGGKEIPGIFVTGEHIVEWDGDDQYASVSSKEDFVNQANVDDYFPDYEDKLNADFWESPGEVYHATTEENADSIEKEGISAESQTRGISNRGEGPAVYTTTELESTEMESYGSEVFAIDVGAMKKDGYTPYTAQEPDVIEGELKSALAHAVGLEDYEYDYEHGMAQDTIAIFGSIPPKYVKRVAGRNLSERFLFRGFHTKAARLRLRPYLLGGPGSGNFGHKGRPGEIGGSGEGGEGGDGATSAPVLKGVDASTNATQETERHLAKWEELTGSRPTAEALQAAEAELRALPLVHGTTVAGALGAMEEGLLSFSEMQKGKADLADELTDVKDEIANLIGDQDVDMEEVAYWEASEAEDALGLEREDAKALVEKVRELRGIEGVLAGKTNPPDAALGLDQFVFMTHGAKHQDYGTVAVIIDNDVLDQRGSFVTEHDIVMTPDALPDLTGKEATGNEPYTEKGVKNYQGTIVRGDGYYQTAAAKAGSEKGILHRSREQLFEVKAPEVPKSAVKGFVVTDYDEAQRLSDKLADRGITGKVLYVEDDRGPEAHAQLKAIQATGAWDEDAASAAMDEGKTMVIL